MQKHSTLLYKFRGYILGIMGIVLLAMPCEPLATASTAINAPYLETYLLCVACLLVGIFVRIRTRQFIGNHTRGNKHQADVLVKNGPYRMIRHPLYLSNLMIAYSFILFHLGMTLLALPYVLTILLFEVALYRMEDRFLQNKFGDEWKDWANKTGALFPKIEFGRQFREESLDAPPTKTFTQAFCSDKSTWLWLSIFILVLFLRKTCIPG